jgi:hypothetical protein
MVLGKTYIKRRLERFKGGGHDNINIQFCPKIISSCYPES